MDCVEVVALRFRMLRDCLVCFFFKQKTAYEVRISDWSSDVCSSDRCTCAIVTLMQVQQRDDGALWHRWQINAGSRLRERALPYCMTKIGRASCRERVCQYV